MPEKKPVRTFVVEDESDALDLLLSMLELHCPRVSVVGTASSIKAAVAALRNLEVDLLFLDVELPGESGFNLLALLPDRTFHTVFVTAHSKYMLRALRAHALDFLLKPIDLDDLLQAVNRATKEMATDNKNNKANSNELLQGFQAKRVALPTRNGQQYINSDEIVYAQADGSYVELFLIDQDRPTVISRKMKEVEEVLTKLGFLRISRSHLVNLDHILEHLRIDGGILVLSNRTEVPVSKSYRSSLTEALKARSEFL